MTAVFLANDENGKVYEILSVQGQSQWGDSSGGGRQFRNTSLMTKDGRGVDRIDQGVYDIIDPVAEKIRVISEDPNAP